MNKLTTTSSSKKSIKGNFILPLTTFAKELRELCAPIDKCPVPFQQRSDGYVPFERVPREVLFS